MIVGGRNFLDNDDHRHDCGDGDDAPPLPPLMDNPQKMLTKNGPKRAKISVLWPKIAVF